MKVDIKLAKVTKENFIFEIEIIPEKINLIDESGVNKIIKEFTSQKEYIVEWYVYKRIDKPDVYSFYVKIPLWKNDIEIVLKDIVNDLRRLFKLLSSNIRKIKFDGFVYSLWEITDNGSFIYKVSSKHKEFDDYFPGWKIVEIEFKSFAENCVENTLREYTNKIKNAIRKIKKLNLEKLS